MKKLTLAAALAVPALASVPAHATHPYQECAVAADLSALARTLGGGVTQASVRYSFRYNLSPIGRAEEPTDLVAIPADGSPATVGRKIWSSLYERALDSVRIEFRRSSGDAEPAYVVVLRPVNDPDEKQAKDAAVVCRSGAD